MNFKKIFVTFALFYNSHSNAMTYHEVFYDELKRTQQPDQYAQQPKKALCYSTKKDEEIEYIYPPPSLYTLKQISFLKKFLLQKLKAIRKFQNILDFTDPNEIINQYGILKSTISQLPKIKITLENYNELYSILDNLYKFREFFDEEISLRLEKVRISLMKNLEIFLQNSNLQDSLREGLIETFIQINKIIFFNDVEMLKNANIYH